MPAQNEVEEASLKMLRAELNGLDIPEALKTTLVQRK